MSTQRQRVAITGSSGLIGGALSSFLRDRGDEVIQLVRREPTTANERSWDPASGELDPASLDGVDAVVNLAGAGIGDKRWTDDYKKVLVSSRIDSTRTVVDALLAADQPARLINGSAMGVYGDRGEEVLTEASTGGEGFLADLVRDWEGAAQPAIDAGVPTAFVRTGLVMSASGGAFGRVLPLAKLGLGGPLGSGKQWWSWISLRDQVRGLAFLIDNPDVTGPVNFSAPAPRRQREVMQELGRQLHRPALLPAPGIALRVVLGEFATDILGSQRMEPAVLQDAGFTWDHPQLPAAVSWLLNQS